MSYLHIDAMIRRAMNLVIRMYRCWHAYSEPIMKRRRNG